MVPLVNRGTETLHFDDAAAAGMPGGVGSPKYAHLAELAYNGLDRMVMQSDLRDIYQGLHVIRFGNTTTGTGVQSEFYLQLSDNSDESRIVDVLRKYLRGNNYSIGGTELFSSGSLIDDITATGTQMLFSAFTDLIFSL